MKLRCLILVLALVSAGCFDDEEPPVPVVVGSQSTTEQRILAEIVAQTLESYGMPAERRIDLGSAADVDRILRDGKIDVAVEYAGQVLITILKSPSTAAALAAGPTEILKRVSDDSASAGLVWTSSLGFDNAYALVVQRGNAAQSISEAVAPAKNWRAAFSLDFQQYAAYYPTLKRVYGLQFGETRTIDAAQSYKALGDHQVDIAVGNITDAALSRLSLRALRDDRNAFPPFQAAPVVRRAAMQQHPELHKALESLRDAIDADTMRRLNEEVENQGKAAADVARDFLATL